MTVPHHPQIEAEVSLRKVVDQKVVLKEAKDIDQEIDGDLDLDRGHSQIEANQKREHRREEGERAVFPVIDTHANL